MKKTSFWITLLLVFVLWLPVQGATEPKPAVSVSIESFDKTLARGTVKAGTVQEALQNVADGNNVPIVFSHTGSEVTVNSVSGVGNQHFTPFDGWHGYIRRDSGILKPANFLNEVVQEDDYIVLYYGNEATTLVPSRFNVHEVEGVLQFEVLSNYVEWKDTDGIWQQHSVEEKLAGVKIHIELPNGNKKIVLTNQEGMASLELDKIGIYKYYGEKYENNQTPSMIRTEDYYYLYGINNPESVTRGEAAAFLVNHFTNEQKSPETFFSDVSARHPLYEEIQTAKALGIVNGYDDGTLKPDEPVTLLQLAAMFSQLPALEDIAIPNGLDERQGMETLPPWAKSAVYIVTDGTNAFSGINLNWNGKVTREHLEKIYFNAG